MIVHPIPPVYDENSEVLILGSFPSVKSREAAFFYGHPQNRFWKVLSGVLEDKCPETSADKRAFLLRHNIAVWDALGSCDIEGSDEIAVQDTNEVAEAVWLTRDEVKDDFMGVSLTDEMISYFKYGDDFPNHLSI